MEQVNTGSTLTKDQVKKLSDNIIDEVRILLNKKVEEEKIKLSSETDKYISDNIKVYEELHSLYKIVDNVIKQYNSKVENINKDINMLECWDNKFSYANLPDLEELKESLELKFYDSKQLTTWYIERLDDVIIHKVQAILCTLNSVSYESIVDVVLKKLNIDDLFDNRQLYLN